MSAVTDRPADPGPDPPSDSTSTPPHGMPEAASGSAGARRSAVRSLLRLWPYVRPVRARLVTAALVAIVASCTGLLIPLALKWIVDGPVAGRDPAGVWLGGALLLGLGVTEAALFGLRRWLVARPLASVEAAMRADLYQHLQRLPVSFHDRWASGQLLSRATADLQLVRIFLAFPLTFLLVNSVTILFGCLVLLAQEWTLGLVLLLPVPPLVVACSVFEARFSAVARQARDQVGDLTTLVEESVLGIRIIKGFGQHRSQARAYTRRSERLRGTELHKARLLATISAVIATLPELALGAALVLGSVRVADGDLSAGTLVAFASTALALRWPVESLGFLIAVSNDSATATDRFFEVLDTPADPDAPAVATPVESVGVDPAVPATHASREVIPSTVRTATGSGEPAGDDAAVLPPPPGDGLRFQGVTFRYPDAPAGHPPTLDGVDLHIRSGETMALVGATGSGKTTLTALVPRLHEVTSGRITLDGVDIATLDRAELRSRVSVAFEEPTLFSATVRENVLMGAFAVDDAELWRALRISQAEEFVTALPHGVHTQVGEQGLSLSGGQRQRLALARAVVGAPRFLVLDDPLSALDVHTEARVEAALRRVLATTTALVVAHRPSTVQLADRVAVLSGGRITAVGTHERLLTEHAEYRTLMSGQLEEEDAR